MGRVKGVSYGPVKKIKMAAANNGRIISVDFEVTVCDLSQGSYWPVRWKTYWPVRIFTSVP